MSLQISTQGTREGVLKYVAAQFPKPEKGADGNTPPDKLPHTSDRAQVENVKALIAAELEALPKEVNGARIHVEAHATPTGRTIQVQIVSFPVAI